MELKNKYKYRLVLDEGISFGSVGRTGRGLTELFNVPVSPIQSFMNPFAETSLRQASQVDMIVGSLATGLSAGGGFCAGSRNVVNHQV